MITSPPGFARTESAAMSPSLAFETATTGRSPSQDDRRRSSRSTYGPLLNPPDDTIVRTSARYASISGTAGRWNAIGLIARTVSDGSSIPAIPSPAAVVADHDALLVEHIGRESRASDLSA